MTLGATNALDKFKSPDNVDILAYSDDLDFPDKKYSEVFLVVTLGGQKLFNPDKIPSEERVVKWAEYYKQSNIPVTVIATTPFEFEGRHAQKASQEQLSVINKIVDNTILIESQDILKNQGPSKFTILDCFYLLDDKIIQELYSLLKAPISIFFDEKE